MATKIKGLILQAIEEVTAPTSNSLIKCIETMADHQNTSADITGKIDAVRAANADVQRMTELLSNIKVSSQQKAEAFKFEGVAINKLLPAIQDYHDDIDRLKQHASDVEDYLGLQAAHQIDGLLIRPTAVRARSILPACVYRCSLPLCPWA